MYAYQLTLEYIKSDYHQKIFVLQRESEVAKKIDVGTKNSDFCFFFIWTTIFLSLDKKRTFPEIVI